VSLLLSALRVSPVASFVRTDRDCSPLSTAHGQAGRVVLFVRTDRSRRLPDHWHRREAGAGTGQRLPLRRGPRAVRTDEHRPRRSEGAVPGHEQLRSELTNKTTRTARSARWPTGAARRGGPGRSAAPAGMPRRTALIARQWKRPSNTPWTRACPASKTGFS